MKTTRKLKSNQNFLQIYNNKIKIELNYYLNIEFMQYICSIYLQGFIIKKKSKTRDIKLNIYQKHVI